jgi:hypothetical protein
MSKTILAVLAALMLSSGNVTRTLTTSSAHSTSSGCDGSFGGDYGDAAYLDAIGLNAISIDPLQELLLGAGVSLYSLTG